MPTPVLILDDSGKRTRMQSAWAQAKAAAQNIVTLYDATGLDALTPSEFIELFTDTESLLYDKITGGTLSFGGVTISKSEGLRLVQKPTGTDALLAAIKQFTQDGINRKFMYDAATEISFDTRNIDQYFVLDGSNTVQFSTTLNTQLSNIGKVYATTDKQIAMFQFIGDVVAAYYNRGLDAHFNYLNENPIPHVVALAMENIDRVNETAIAKVQLSVI